MADYTPEQVEALAEFARWVCGFASHNGELMRELQRLGLVNPDGTLADWLRPEDWADRAAREWLTLRAYNGTAVVNEAPSLAAIIRRHAEGRT